MIKRHIEIEKDTTLYPIEIKKYTNFEVRDMKSFKVLSKLKDIKVGNGAIICMHKELLKLKDCNYIIPVNYL